MDIQSI